MYFYLLNDIIFVKLQRNNHAGSKTFIALIIIFCLKIQELRYYLRPIVIIILAFSIHWFLYYIRLDIKV